MTLEELELHALRALQGKFGASVQRAVEARYRGCLRVHGVTPDALRVENPAAYQRLVEGHGRAIVRVRLVEDGNLSPREWSWLKRREIARRNDDVFDGLFDNSSEEVA